MIRRILTFFGGLFMQILRGIGRALAEIMRNAAYRAGRFIGRLALWVGSAVAGVWLIQNKPGIVGPVIAIIILVMAIRYMLTAPFRKKR